MAQRQQKTKVGQQLRHPSFAVPSKRTANAKDTRAKAPRRSTRGSTQKPTRCRQAHQSPPVPSEHLNIYASSHLTPFEEFDMRRRSQPSFSAMCWACDPFGPCSTIRIILPFTTPKKIRIAGFRPVEKALDEARTQHRQRTAEGSVLSADAVVGHLGDGEGDVSLEKKIKAMLKTHAKGLGKPGLDILARRVQALWPNL
ncbi:MAG: hypothetical protein Q9211_002290 [Gyalolechia sp. 1 TL-2023]